MLAASVICFSPFAFQDSLGDVVRSRPDGSVTPSNATEPTLREDVAAPSAGSDYGVSAADRSVTGRAEGQAFTPGRVSPSSEMQRAAAQRSHCPHVRKGLRFYTKRAREWRERMGAGRVVLRKPLTRAACPQIRRAAEIARWRSYVARYHAERFLERMRDPARAICHVFREYCAQAIAVAKCESGWSMTPRAHNGTYLGVFQMGESERRLYGHGNTVLEQARAAYRYFVNSGKNWEPWSCKP